MIVSSFFRVGMLRCAGLLLSVIGVCCSASHDKGAETQAKESTFVERHGRLKVVGTTLVDQHNAPLVLQGVSLGWHNWWPRFYNTETINWLNSDWNCNLVRAAIGVEPDGAYLDNPELALQHLYTVVDAAIQRGMYVIVDWHAHEMHTVEAKDFFVQVATKYKGHPNLLYEIYNEPIEDSWADLKLYAEEVIGAIREIDANSIVLVGCPHWDQDIHIVAEDPLVGIDNVMYTVHFYAGTHKEPLRQRTEYALGKGIPVFISECAGMEATGDGPIDHEEWRTWLAWMQQKQLSWVAWSIADKNETCSMIKDGSSPVSIWKEADLKEWGKLIRGILIEEN